MPINLGQVQFGSVFAMENGSLFVRDCLNVNVDDIFLCLLQGVSGTQQGKVVAAAGQAGLVSAQFIVQQASASGAAHQAAQGKIRNWHISKLQTVQFQSWHNLCRG
jgi:hypothetical protein